MKILYFAHVAQAVGRREDNLDVSAPVTAEALWDRLLVLRPALAPYRASIYLARNRAYATGDDQFLNDDEVALLPPVSGG